MENTTTITGAFGVLRVETEVHEFSTLGAMVPDPDWTFTDARGHKHYRDAGAYPTLRWVVDRTWWCPDCRDEHDEGHYECTGCGEHIEPGSRYKGPAITHERGGRSFYLNEEPISEDEARRILDEAKSGT